MQPSELVQVHFGEFQAILGVFLTNKCNIVCRHCGTKSSPLETSHCNIQPLLNKLEAAVKAGVVRGLHINGGEPFLFRKDIQRLALEGKRLNILVGVNTNAFWATTVQEAADVLTDLPGITQLMISTDSYHEEYIPLERVKNAATAALRIGTSAQIAVCTIAGKIDTTVVRLRGLLGPDLLEKIPIGINPVEAVGRAVSIQGADWRPQTAVLPGGRCSQINRPVILEDGTVLACCNTCVAGACLSSPLNLGNIANSEIKQIYDDANADLVVQAIRALGPKFLADILVEDGHAAMLKPNYSKDDICGLCGSMMSVRATVNILEQALSSKERRRQIAIARAAEFNEVEMLFDLQRTTGHE